MGRAIEVDRTHQKHVEAKRKKFRPEVIEPFLKSLEEGIPLYHAAAMHGITRQTIQAWYNMALKGDPYYEDFHVRVDEAVAKAKIAAIKAFRSGLVEQVERRSVRTRETVVGPDGTERQVITERDEEKVIPPDWRAGRDYLERSDPENWSGQMSVVIRDETADPVRVIDYRSKMAQLMDPALADDVVDGQVTVEDE